MRKELKQKLMARLVVMAILVVGSIGTIAAVSTYSGSAPNYSGPAPKVVVEGDYIEAVSPALQSAIEQVQVMGSGSRFGGEDNASNFGALGLIDSASGTKRLVKEFWFDTFRPGTGVGAVTTSLFFENRFGKHIYVDAGETFAQLNGVVSSTVLIGLGTSTRSGYPSAYGVATATSSERHAIIAAYRAVTSTRGLSDSGLVQSTSSRKLFLLRNTEFLIWNFLCDAGAAGIVCDSVIQNAGEQVTSTNNGYTVSTTVVYYRIEDHKP